MKFVEVLRHKRENYTSAYLQFILTKQKSPKEVHAFFEGHPDSSFYTNFLLRFISNPELLHSYKCGNKKGVYDAYQKIRANKMLNKKVVFFVDKDLSDVLDESYPVATNIYVTDYYSIENYLVTEDMLLRVWNELFRFSNVEIDFRQTREKFQIELKRFY